MRSLGLLIAVVFLTQSIIENHGASMGEGVETPAKAMTVAFGICLAGGLVLTLMIDLSRALWLRAKRRKRYSRARFCRIDQKKKIRRGQPMPLRVRARREARQENKGLTPTVVRR